MMPMNKDPFLQKLAEESKQGAEAKGNKVAASIKSAKKKLPDPMLSKYEQEGILGTKPGTVKVSDKEVKSLEQSVKDGDLEKAASEKLEQTRDEKIAGALGKINDMIANERLAAESLIFKDRLRKAMFYYIMPSCAAVSSVGFALNLIGVSLFDRTYGAFAITVILGFGTLLMSGLTAVCAIMYMKGKRKIEELESIQKAVVAVAYGQPTNEAEITKLMKTDLFDYSMKELTANGSPAAESIIKKKYGETQ